MTSTTRGRKAVAPQATGALGAAPAHLTPTQAALWHYHVRHAAPEQLPAMTGGLLTAFVVAVDMHRQAAELIGGELVVESISGALKPHPTLAIPNAQAAIMLRAGAELGFTPASRSRVTVTPEPGPTDEFFG